jgi:dihydropteroate synthase
MTQATWAGLRAGPCVMGILNVTPDSFSDGGRHFDPAIAIEAGLKMVQDGAAILDIGGESTRPGASRLDPAVEQARILPVIAGLRNAGVPLSIDTRNAATMAAALDAGAAIVNDVSALNHDPDAAAAVAKRDCPVILMHMRGTPETMNALAQYGDVGAEVASELAAQMARAERAGIRRANIAIDPGFGFAKDAQQNAALLRGLARFTGSGVPVVVGVSRKRFISALSGADDLAGRDAGSLAAGLFALGQGAAILRVHDVLATVRAMRVWQALAA